jgi:hypothetical protein
MRYCSVLHDRREQNDSDRRARPAETAVRRYRATGGASPSQLARFSARRTWAMRFVALSVLLALSGVIVWSAGLSEPLKSRAASLTSLPILPPVADQHNEYVFTNKGYYVYRQESNFALVDTVPVTGITQLRDVVADRNGYFYISYGGNHVKKWNFETKTQVWDKTYSPATDAGALSPDAATLYMATGSYNAPTWLAIRTSDGAVTSSIHASGNGSHNTDISVDGRYVYLGIHNTPQLGVYDTVTKTVSYVTGLKSGVRPIAVTSRYAFVAQTNLFGFSTGSLSTHRTLFTTYITGYPSTSAGYVASKSNSPSHGVSVSPDEKEVWVMDKVNGMVHVFDVTGLPTVAPKQIYNIALANMDGNESECNLACFREGWIQFSRDGNYVFVGDTGRVVSAATKQVVATLPELSNSRKHIEVDWNQGTPVWASPSRSQQGYMP